MNKILEKVGNGFKKCKEKMLMVGAGATVATLTASSYICHADGTAPAGTADSNVSTAFAQGAADSKATMYVVLGSAVGIMVVFMIIKYAKKIYNKVAN